MTINALKVQVVQDLELLGHRCGEIHRFIAHDAEEAANEARIRTKRIGTLPIGAKLKGRL